MSVRIVNDFVHDVALGLWPGTVVGLWIVHGLLGSVQGVPQQINARVFSAIWVLVGVLVAQVVTGSLRLRYYELNLRTGTLSAKHRMVLIKHGLFVTLLVVCTVWFFTLLPPAG